MVPVASVFPNCLEVCLSLSQNLVTDLVVELVAPNGTRVPLMMNRGGFLTTTLTDVCFSDDATTQISSFGVINIIPSNAVYVPEQPLANFAGAPVNGVWTLEITHTMLLLKLLEH